MSVAQLACLAIVLGASWTFTGLVRRYALRRGILDVPNERSSHDRPIPRGGGLAIAGAVSLGVAVAGAANWIPSRVVWAVLVGGGGVALAGWVDDRWGLSALTRLLVQLAAAAVTVALFGGMPELRTGMTTVHLGWAGSVLALLAITWGINLFNFMDGIDGLAGAEAALVGLAAGLLMAGGHFGLAFASWVVAAASLGFLWWNWAPARIFMGDVGSGYLGFVLGTLALASERAGGLPGLLWLVLLGLFFVDATATLVRRVIRGEAWHLAHRTHAYQLAVRLGWSHAQVTLGALAVNLTLVALAAVGTSDSRRIIGILVAALAGLLLLHLWILRRAQRALEAGSMTSSRGPQGSRERFL